MLPRRREPRRRQRWRRGAPPCALPRVTAHCRGGFQTRPSPATRNPTGGSVGVGAHGGSPCRRRYGHCRGGFQTRPPPPAQTRAGGANSANLRALCASAVKKLPSPPGRGAGGEGVLPAKPPEPLCLTLNINYYIKARTCLADVKQVYGR